MDHALCLLMLRCGLRVSEVARLRLSDIDWTQQSLRIEQGKGRKDRIVYVSADVLAALRTCLPARPAVVPGELVFWNQKRPHRPLSISIVSKCSSARCWAGRTSISSAAASCGPHEVDRHRLQASVRRHRLTLKSRPRSPKSRAWRGGS